MINEANLMMTLACVQFLCHKRLQIGNCHG